VNSNDITLYVGLGIVILGAGAWFFKQATTSESIIKGPGFSFTLHETSLAIIALGIILVIISRLGPPEEQIVYEPKLGVVPQPAPAPALSTDVSSFNITVSLVGVSQPVSREWRRMSATQWSEIYPDGTKYIYDVVGPFTLNGCAGTVVKEEGSTSHQVFIPNKNCPGMPFSINDDNKGWGGSSAMTNVK
jgi:hypothetical protein